MRRKQALSSGSLVFWMKFLIFLSLWKGQNGGKFLGTDNSRDKQRPYIFKTKFEYSAKLLLSIVLSKVSNSISKAKISIYCLIKLELQY